MLHRIVPALIAVAAAMALVAPSPAFAQTGMVKGKVVDAEGKPVPEAAVTVESVGGMNRKLSTKADKPRRVRAARAAIGRLSRVGHRSPSSAPGSPTSRCASATPPRSPSGSRPSRRAPTPSWPSVKVAFEEGVAASRAQNHDLAIAKFQEALAIQPACAECYFNIGFAYLQKKDEKQAEENWKKALEQKADHPETLNALATLYNNQKRFDEAAAVSAKAAASAPAGNADAIYNQGIILWNAGKIPEAKTKFEEAVKANPGHADARFQLGMALINEGKLPEAAASFEEYLKLAPTGQFAAQAKAMLAQLKPPAA